MATNYALQSNGGVASTPDGNSPGYPVTRINDGNMATEWYAQDAGFPKTVYLTLSTIRAINQVKVYFLAGYKPGSWSVYYKNSGGTYTLIETQTDNSGSSYTHNFATDNTDEIKVVSNSIGSGQSNFAAWNEIEVWGDPAADTTRPDTMVLTSATVINAGQINLAFSAPTDNVGVTAIKVQRATSADFSANLVEYDNQSATSPFQNTSGLNPTVTTTYYYRAKAKDAAGNYSTNWSNTISAEIVYVPPPVITSPATLPYARIGYYYTYQLQKSGGSGAGTWSASVQGNLPGGQPSSGGLITIPVVGGSNYTFTSRFDDANGTFDTQAHTIPVTNMALWEWCYKRPLPIEHLWAHRIYEPLVGTDKAFEDKPTGYRFTLDVQYLENTERDNIIAFIEAHRLRQSFLFATENDPLVYYTCKIVEAPDRAEMLTYGGIRVIFETV